MLIYNYMIMNSDADGALQLHCGCGYITVVPTKYIGLSAVYAQYGNAVHSRISVSTVALPRTINKHYTLSIGTLHYSDSRY